MQVCSIAASVCAHAHELLQLPQLHNDQHLQVGCQVLRSSICVYVSPTLPGLLALPNPHHSAASVLTYYSVLVLQQLITLCVLLNLQHSTLCARLVQTHHSMWLAGCRPELCDADAGGVGGKDGVHRCDLQAHDT
jgi:hypothetical protein